MTRAQIGKSSLWWEHPALHDLRLEMGRELPNAPGPAWMMFYGSYPDIDEMYSRRRSSSITRSARRSCTRCSRSYTSGRSMRRSGNWPSSRASARAPANPALA